MSDGLVDEIVAEAERIRRDGTLPAGFEAAMRARFEEIADDPAALEAELARRQAVSDPLGAVPHPGSLPSRAARKATSLTRRAGRAGRRRLGPPVRALQRQGIEAAGRLVEQAAVGWEVAADTGRRASRGTIAERGLARARQHQPAAATDVVPRALRRDAGGRLADEELDRFLVGRVSGCAGPVLQAESGDGRLVERLRALGCDARGVDPRSAAGPARRGALEGLARNRPGSLGGVVLCGVVDHVTPARAHALASLVVTRLARGGVVVLLSTNPAPRDASDPISADLSPGRPLHPTTWCHLFARLGLEGISVRESSDGSAYAVAAVRG